jgi:3-hydroxyacyl-CoA dehydrogenase/enoyl-CoA hydratase/3-hydroxybutyryl-CoA epimerase
MSLAFHEETRDTAGVFGPFRMEPQPSGVALLRFDDPARKVNLLDSASLAALREALDSLRGRTGPSFPRALVITSGKPGQFIAGADVNEFESVGTPKEAAAKAKEAQLLFQSIAELPYPTVAAINGACLGGGTELALACRYRVAAAGRGVSIGCPEVMLGILPGFGGTTRLPRLVGLIAGLDLLLTGRALDSRRALRTGLVDAVLPQEGFEGRALQWTETLLTSGRPVQRKVPDAVTKVMQSVQPLRSFVIGQARKKVLRETHGNYPAPLEILRLLSTTWGKPIPKALEREREAVARLLFTPQSQNLRRIFLMSEEAKRKPEATRAREVSRIGVIGAGVMGGEIAYLASRRGIRVRLRDIKTEPILRSLAHARSLYDRERSRGRLSRAEVEQAMGRIEPSLDPAGLSRTDLILEAVVEDLPLKQSLFRELEGRIPEQCVLATNTSSLSVEAMAKGLRRPERVVGMHFFNPATRMPLVEVIRTPQSDPAAVDLVIALARRMGKTAVLVADAPGFLVNRVLMPYLSEAVGLVERGQSIPEIDRALRRFGMPMGPLELLDEIGLDVARKVAHVLEESFGERMPKVALLDRLASSGAMGKKSGLGFYRYEKGRRREVNPAVTGAVAPGSAAEASAGHPTDETVNRLVDAMVNEAALALEERVVARPEEVDLAMVMGTGFPPFRGGLLRHADAAGVGTIVERLARRQQAGAPGGPCGRLQRMALGGERFYKP